MDPPTTNPESPVSLLSNSIFIWGTLIQNKSPKKHIQLILLVNGAFKWVFPRIGIPQNGWFIMEHPIKMDDLGVPLFSETSKW